MPPPPPLPYRTPEPTARGSGLRTAFKWVLGVLGVLLLCFFVLVRKAPAPAGGGQIPLSDFQTYLQNGTVASVTITGDELRGTFNRPVALPSGAAATTFVVPLTPSVVGSWQFVEWVLDNRGTAVVSMDSDDDLLINILVPLIPWLLIFGFLWFFIFRGLRKAQAAQQPMRVVVVGTEQQQPPP
jgi:ATP-dependent Zn protease